MNRSLSPVDRLFATLPALAEEAAARAGEFETLRRLAPDFVARLKEAGALKLLVPAEAGGIGLTLPQWLEAVMALAEADASTGWVTAHGNICAGLIYACAEPQFRDEFFADPQACAAWSNLPRITAETEAGGIRITGSWGFESGCTAATFVGGMVQLPPAEPGGRPRMVAALAPVAEARIAETWDPVGLAGTGSHDVHFDQVLVPWHRTFAWPSGRPQPGLPYPQAIFSPGTWFISIGAGATHLGLARRALDEARRELAGKKDRYTQQPLLENPATQRSLEAAEGLWFACRAGLREALAEIWDSALRGVPATAEQRLAARLAAVTATQQGAAIVRTAYDAAGAGAIRRGGVLQRLLREAACLTHHVTASPASYELTGRVRCGIDPISFRI
ncbi:acyl-CoA dehydrogenase family protein [Ferrovibrio sp.]|uniref:acyl-CoA dehydrogenase family protein n=2 Tax=Ferrovibrio sp. TaxID=1917215 RepID=UPI003518F903